MVLVDYPESESDSSDTTQAKEETDGKSTNGLNRGSVSSLKRKHEDLAASVLQTATVSSSSPPPPPLPTSFYSLYATNARTSTSDDPSLHGGRKRQVPHVEGNWPTHVYLEWFPSYTELVILEKAIAKAQPPSSSNDVLHSFLQSELGVQLPLHISLSASLVLRTEKRADFEEALEIEVRDAGVRAFCVQFAGIGWEPNFEKTRWFLVLRLTRPEGDGLNVLLRSANHIAQRMQLPVLYEKPNIGVKHASDYTSRFHISIGWQLNEPTSHQRNSVAMEIEQLAGLKTLSVLFKCLKVKIGNTIREIHLPERRISVQGFGGT